MRGERYCSHILITVADDQGKIKYLVQEPSQGREGLLPGGRYPASRGDSDTDARNKIEECLRQWGIKTENQSFRFCKEIKFPAALADASEAEALVCARLYHLEIRNDSMPELFGADPKPPQGMLLISGSELVQHAWADRRQVVLRHVLKKLYETEVFPYPQEVNFLPSHAFNAPCVEMALQTYIEQLLTPLIGEGTYDVQVLTPEALGVPLRGAPGKTLEGRIEIRWSGTEKPMIVNFPCPVHGVFSIKAPKKNNTSFWTWRPRLTPKPGLWKVRKVRYKKDKHGIPCQTTGEIYRFALPGANHIDIEVDDAAMEKRLRKTARALDTVIPLPHNITQNSLQAIIGKYWPCLYNTGKDIHHSGNRLLEFCRDLSGWCAENKDLFGACDEQDLAYQCLYTFNVFILDAMTRRLLESMPRSWVQRIRKGLAREENLERVWEYLCIEGTLVDYREMRRNFLLLFEPRNAIEAASQLSTVTRYDVQGERIKRESAVRRQNHPSYAGYLCPAETPDSTGVGLTLHLARGVRCNVMGNLLSGSASSTNAGKQSALGTGASLVPFYAHNDGARAMMGAKNMKQAVPVKKAHLPLLKTGTEEEPEAVCKPLIDLGWLPDGKEFTWPGVDLIVAYMPWYGWNTDDAIVAGTHLKETLVYDHTDSFIHPLRPGFNPKLPTFDQDCRHADATADYDEAGLRKTGSLIFNGRILAYCQDEEGAVSRVRFKGEPGLKGILDKIVYIEAPSPFFGGSLHYSVRQIFPLSPGDKLMGRHGNKGVISRLVDATEMPRLPEDRRLGALSGKTVDLILNPHGIISRMNIGQLMETQFALLKYLGIEIPGDAGTPFRFADSLEKIQGDFVSFLNQQQDLIDAYGRIRLCLPSGGTTPPVVVGVQHFFRLDHKPAGKAAAYQRGETVPIVPRDLKVPAHENAEHDAYSRVTGQPVRTFVPGDRPQRVGEMEMWALDASQANNIRSGLLRKKSLPDTIAGAEGPTFEAIMAFLLAAGIETRCEGDTFQYAWLDEGNFKEQAHEAASAGVWELATRADYQCPICRDTILYQVAASGKTQKIEALAPTIADVLRHSGIDINRLSGDAPEGIARPERGAVTGTVTLLENIVLTITRTANVVTATFGLKQPYTAYAQTKKKSLSVRDILGLRVVCPLHKEKGLVAAGELSREAVAVPGGLADEGIYGRADARYSVFSPELSGWGYITLPERVPHPLWKQAELQIGMIPVLPLRFRYPLHDIEGWTNEEHIEYHEDLTRCYANIIQAKRSLEGAQRQNKPAAKSDLERAVNQLYKTLHKRLFQKDGLIRRFGLGRQVHFSGRFVIVPDPDLEWNACRVPLPALITWLGDALESEFLQVLKQHPDILLMKPDNNYPPEIGRWKVREILNKIWASGSTDGLNEKEKRFLAAIERAVKTHLDENKHLRVLLNRQPTLHRYNIQAFRPCVQPMDRGLVLSIHPLVCAGFNADFDGDTMAIHFISDSEECKEAEAMLPSHPRNLLSVANGNPTAGYDQDMVLGTYLLSMEKEKRQAFFENLGITPCETCITLLKPDGGGWWDKKVGVEFMRHLCKSHLSNIVPALEKWVECAYREATEKGISFGYLELAEMAKGIRNDIGKELAKVERVKKRQENATLKPEDANEHLESVALKYLGEKIKQGMEHPGFGFAAMALSGARGKKQVRQIIGARGYLSPGDIGFVEDEEAPTAFFISSNLVDGMMVDEAYHAAMNSRSSMIDKKLLTPKAGYLTRRLAMACWDWQVKAGNCGRSGGSPASCLWAMQKQKRVCEACYGSFPGYETMDGFPAGITAALSIGERGTQLSMRSFHTGTREISLDGIILLLEGRDLISHGDTDLVQRKNWFETVKDADEFVRRFQEQGAYADIDKRHLLLLWRIIHEGEGEKSLSRVWLSSRSIVSGLAGGNARQFLVESIAKKESRSDDSAIGKLLRNCPFTGSETAQAHSTKVTNPQEER